jgi:2-hydroxycyclohexanecarboxyl-CoA dehydrogenase
VSASSEIAQLAIVTGAAGGIGQAIASKLSQRGYAVAVCDIRLDAVREVANTLRQTGARASPFYVDLSKVDTIHSLEKKVYAELGVPTVIVNNAGWTKIEPFMENTFGFWQDIIGINLLGPIALTHAFLNRLLHTKQLEDSVPARIVNISSDAGRVGSAGETVYASAKGGIIAFTKSLARELARYNITVNCVCPGPTDTSLLQQQADKRKEALLRAIPFKRFAQPSDIAEAVDFLASPSSSYVTGQVLSVSGGLTMAG